MKVGDLVRHAPVHLKKKLVGTKVGLIVEMGQKKCWRTAIQGKQVDWNAVDPEPHAVVLYSHNAGTVTIPAAELEVVRESG